jgi:hypothetical protein
MKTDVEALEVFLLDSGELECLEAIVAEFNVLDTLDISQAEIRHSKVLSWLVDPKGNHGLGDWFLRRFLMSMLSHELPNTSLPVTVFDIDHFDFSDAQIHTEWHDIDIALISRQNRFALAIENKIGSSEHGDQLARYNKVLNDEFPDFKIVRILLSPGAETPSDEEWLARDHAAILALIEETIERKGTAISSRVLDFLGQYATSLRRYIVGNSEIEQICKNIYRKHQRALDLIFQYRPQIADFIRDLVQNEANLVLDSAGKQHVRFTTKKLDGLVPAEGSGWTPTGRVLLFEFGTWSKKVDLRLYIGPGSPALRERLHALAKLDDRLFNKASRSGGEKWSSIYQKEFARSQDFDNPEEGHLEELVKQRFQVFFNEDLGKIESHFESNWRRV